jgi:prepilin-type N-terminal cleavage/methylation domain-containing protein
MLNERGSEQRLRQVSGFTLIELLVGLTVGAIVLLTLALSWSLAVRDQVYILSVTALNNDMRSLMQIVTQDARRAVAPDKTAVGQQFVEIVNSGSVDAPEDCVVFNAHIGGEEVGPEAELRFVRSADNSEGPTLVPSGYRLRAGQFEVWAPPAQTGTTPLDDTERANYQGFGKCGLATLATPGSDGINWWTPLLVNGDRGIFLDSFAVTTLNPVDATIGSKCLSLEQDPTTGAFIEDYPTVANDRCLDDDRNKVEVLTLFFELAGRVRVVNLDRPFVFADSVKVRNDWVIGDF